MSEKVGSLFWKKTDETKGKISILKETTKSLFNYSTEDSIVYKSENPTVLGKSDSLGLVSVGFDNGQIITYTIEHAKLSKFSSAKPSAYRINIIIYVEKEGALITTGDDNCLYWVELDKENTFCDEVSANANTFTALHMNPHYSVLLAGDHVGSLFAYKCNPSKRGGRLRLLYSQFMNVGGISSITADSKGDKIVLGFQNGVVHLFETGSGFENKPVLVAKWEFMGKIITSSLTLKPANLLLGHGNGLVTFCDLTNPNNVATFMSLSGLVIDVQIDEKEKILMVATEEGFRLCRYPAFLFSEKPNPGRTLNKFDASSLEKQYMPGKQTQSVEAIKDQSMKEKEKKDQKKENSSTVLNLKKDEDEDEMIGWNQ